MFHSQREGFTIKSSVSWYVTAGNNVNSSKEVYIRCVRCIYKVEIAHQPFYTV